MTVKFPTEDGFLDFEGRKRTFRYTVLEIGSGYSVKAIERKEDGYAFSAFSEATPFAALGQLRTKIRKRLSTRYLHDEDGHLQLYHDEAKGQILYGGVVIDGQFITFDEFVSMLQTYEGFLLELNIRDLSDE